MHKMYYYIMNIPKIGLSADFRNNIANFAEILDSLQFTSAACTLQISSHMSKWFLRYDAGNSVLRKTRLKLKLFSIGIKE